VIAWIPLLAVLIPEVGKLISAIGALRTKYPAMTPEMTQQLVAEIAGQSNATLDGVLAQILADQAAHPVVP
jgi:hypothetical protein